MSNRAGQQLGHYRLIRLLGRGGFAEVYLGEHLYLKNLAAIKVLRTSLADEEVDQFLSEAQTLARLSHPQIVRVLDFAVEQGTPFLAMEYAPRGTLRTLHPRGSCLSLDTTVSYINQMATALQYAHNHQVIHRDVKPENMLLNAQQQVMLSDFGIVPVCLFPTLLTLYIAWGALSSSTVGSGIFFIAISACLIAVAEESIFRGIILQTLLPKGVLRALFLSTLIFALLHVGNLFAGLSWAYVSGQVLYTFGGGMAYAVMRVRTGSIWPAIILHGLTDFGALAFTATTGIKPSSFLSALLAGGSICAVYLIYAAIALRPSNYASYVLAFNRKLAHPLPGGELL